MIIAFREVCFPSSTRRTINDPDFKPVVFHETCEDFRAEKDKSSSSFPWTLKILRDANGEIAFPSTIPWEFTDKADGFPTICDLDPMIFEPVMSIKLTLDIVTVELLTDGHAVA